MHQISVAEMLGKLSLWGHEKSPLLATFLTTGQVAVGGADLDLVSDAGVTITLRRAIKHVQLTEESPLVTTSFTPSDILAVWSSTTFEQPHHESLALYFDEVLQIMTRPATPSVTIWRATPQSAQ